MLIDEIDTVLKNDLPATISKFHELGYYVSVEALDPPKNILWAEGRYKIKVLKWVEQ
ncbi:hypothetical protein P0202_22115 [Escherichia coli]